MRSTRTLDMKLLLDELMVEATRIVGLDCGTICLINPDNTFNLISEIGISDATKNDFSNNKIVVGDCLCGNCAIECKPLILKSKQEVLEYASREVLQGEDIRYHAAFPLVVGHKCLGVVCVFTHSDIKPDQRKVDLLETITKQTAIVIENASLYEEIKKNNYDLEQRVLDRTQELEQKNAELARMNRLFVGRELRMVELKNKIAEIENQLKNQ